MGMAMMLIQEGLQHFNGSDVTMQDYIYAGLARFCDEQRACPQTVLLLKR
jgi:hypothetical protein